MKYVIKTIIIGLMLWTVSMVGSKAELKDAYIGYPGEFNKPVMATQAYIYDLDWYKKFMDLILEKRPIEAEAVWKHMLQVGKADMVEPGYVPVHNCTPYKVFTICQIIR